MKPLLAAIRFLTIVPVPGAWGTAEEDLARSVPWFPMIGLLAGRGSRRTGVGPVLDGAAHAGGRRAGRRSLEFLRLPAPGRTGRHGRRLPEFPPAGANPGNHEGQPYRRDGRDRDRLPALAEIRGAGLAACRHALAGRAAHAACRAMRDRRPHGPLALRAARADWAPSSIAGQARAGRQSGRREFWRLWALASLGGAGWWSGPFAWPRRRSSRHTPIGRSAARPATPSAPSAKSWKPCRRSCLAIGPLGGGR